MGECFNTVLANPGQLPEFSTRGVIYLLLGNLKPGKEYRKAVPLVFYGFPMNHLSRALNQYNNSYHLKSGGRSINITHAFMDDLKRFAEPVENLHHFLHRMLCSLESINVDQYIYAEVNWWIPKVSVSTNRGRFETWLKSKRTSS